MNKPNLPPNATMHTEKGKVDNSQLRGLSEAFFFSFHIADEKSKQLVSHGVIFTSAIRPSNVTIDLLTEDSDPRVKQLVDYVYANWFQDKFKALEKRVAELTELAPKAKVALTEIETIIARDKEKLAELNQKLIDEQGTGAEHS